MDTIARSAHSADPPSHTHPTPFDFGLVLPMSSYESYSSSCDVSGCEPHASLLDHTPSVRNEADGLNPPYYTLSRPSDLPDVFEESCDEGEDDEEYEQRILSTKRRRIIRDEFVYAPEATHGVGLLTPLPNGISFSMSTDCEDPFADPDPETYYRHRVHEWSWHPAHPPPPSSTLPEEYFSGEADLLLPSIILTPPKNDDYETVTSLCHSNHIPMQDSCFSNRLTVPTYLMANRLPEGIPRGYCKEVYSSEFGIWVKEVPCIEIQMEEGLRGHLITELYGSDVSFLYEDVDPDDASYCDDLVSYDGCSDVPSLDDSVCSSPISPSNSPHLPSMELAPSNTDAKGGIQALQKSQPVSAWDDDDDFFEQDPITWFNAPAVF